MLPLWPEPKRLLLDEKQLCFLQRGKTQKVSLPVEQADHIDFDAMQAALPPELGKLSGQKLTVSLSNAWVRYLTVPWQPNVYAHRDWVALAENRFRERYGAKSADWVVRVGLQGYKQPVLAAAVDRTVAEGLDRLADSHRWQLTLVEPVFNTLINLHPRYWKGDSWLLMGEANHIILAESRSGVWQRFSSMLTTPDMIEQHALMLIQQARQFSPDVKKRRLYLYCEGHELAQDFIGDMDVRLIPAIWPAGDKS